MALLLAACKNFYEKKTRFENIHGMWWNIDAGLELSIDNSKLNDGHYTNKLEWIISTGYSFNNMKD